MYLVAVGNLDSGFTFYGPFKGFDVALEWTEQHLEEGAWLLAELVEPTRFGTVAMVEPRLVPNLVKSACSYCGVGPRR